jgi:transposase
MEANVWGPEPARPLVFRVTAPSGRGEVHGSRGGRPAGFDETIYKRRNEVERTIDALKNFRAVTTRFDKRAYVFHGTVTLASIRLWLWLRP